MALREGVTAPKRDCGGTGTLDQKREGALKEVENGGEVSYVHGLCTFEDDQYEL